MRKSSRVIGCCLAILSLLLAACHYRPVTSMSGGEGDSLSVDSTRFKGRIYPLSSNFQVWADTLWLHLLPFTDTVPVFRGDCIVVAEVDIHPRDSVDSVWVKVARDQETIGWIRECHLLEHIVPVDPISRCIHWFSSSHTLPFFLVLGVFFLWFVYRAVRRKQIRLIWLNDIDSVYPLVLSMLMAVAATLYNSIQHFVPQTWEQYYYNPTLNPFQVPFILGLFIFCVGLIVLVGAAMLDDLFHQTKLEVAFFYLVGLASCCIFLYIFFTYVWIYVAYICLSVYVGWCIRRLCHARKYVYICGACGAKMRSKGICPHCGALNE